MRLFQKLTLAAILCPLFLQAQIIPEKSKVPNYILRNQDFQDRRVSEEDVSFAHELYQAYQVKSAEQKLHKNKKTWTPRGPFGNERLAGTGRINSMQFHPTDTNTWFICVAQGGLWKTNNAGESWIPISGDLPILRTSYLSIHPQHPDTMYVAMGDFAYLGHNLQANENKRNSHYGIGIYKTTNGGESWKPTGLSFKQTDFEGSLIAKVMINPSNPKQLIAIGQTGCYLSDDEGDNWTKTQNGLFWDLEIDPNNDQVLYASTGYVHAYKYGEVSILKSTDFGKNWTAASTPIPKTGKVQRVELAVSPSDPNYIYAIACDTIGGFYGFYRSTDAGKNYNKRLLGTEFQYNILNNSLDSEPGGQGRYDLAICVDKNDKNKVLIGGINIWQTDNGGTSFKPVTYWRLNYRRISMHGDVHEILQHPSNNSFFACHDGGISRTFKVIPDNVFTLKDEEKSSTIWEYYTKGLNITSFYRLSINEANSDEIIVGSQDNSTVFSADSSTFRNLSGGDGMESDFDDESRYTYTSSQNGFIYAYYRSKNSGNFSYEETIYPPGNEIGEWTTPFIAHNHQIFVLYGNLYNGYSGYLAQNLSDFNNIPGYGFPRPGTALDIERSGFQHIYLAKRGYASRGISNKIYASENGGKNWSEIGSGLPNMLYPSYITMSQSKPLNVWITFSGFDDDEKVFASDNGGKSWTNITYNLPNIPVNCIVHQDDTSEMLYIGTDLGVYYLKKGSTKWESYSSDLPNVIVSELEIDTSKNRLVAATFGRGIWQVDLLYPFVKEGVGIEKTELLTPDVRLFPNRTKDKITVQFEPLKPADFTIRILDITGKTVLKKSLFKVHGLTEISIRTNHLNSGQYYLILENQNSRSTKKFIKY